MSLLIPTRHLATKNEMAIPPYTNPPKHDVVMGQTGAYRGDAFHCLILAIFAEIYQTSEIRIKRGTHSWQTVFLVCAAKLRLYFGTRVFHFVPILKNVKLFRFFVEKEVKKDGSALSKLKKNKRFSEYKIYTEASVPPYKLFCKKKAQGLVFIHLFRGSGKPNSK